MNTPLKIAFLFGAGAEAKKENFDQLVGGDYFNKTVLSPDETVYDALKGKFGGTYFGSCQYSRHKIYSKGQSEKKALRDMLRLYLEQKYYLPKNDNYQEFKDAVEKTTPYMTKEFLTSLQNDLSIGNGEKNKEFYQSIENIIETQSAQDFELVIDEFNKVLANEELVIETDLMKLLAQETKNKKCKYEFKYNITSSGFFEKYFHTIIDPSKYSRVNFIKIFNYYWSCYFALIDVILTMIIPEPGQYREESDRKLLERIVIHTTYDYEVILENIQHFTKILYSDETFKIIAEKGKESYYQYLKSSLEEDKAFELSGVLTSNYYRYAELLGEKDQIAYLNGELKLFEFPEILTIGDVSDDSYDSIIREKLFFPFILGQSMLKPVIASQQIYAFNKALNILNKSDILVILGYNINEDDNHINVLLREFVTAKKDRKIFVMGNNDVDQVVRKLRLTDEEQIVPIGYDYKKKKPNEAISLLFDELRKEVR